MLWFDYRQRFVFVVLIFLHHFLPLSPHIHTYIHTMWWVTCSALFDSLLCSMQNLNDAKMLLQEMTRVLRFGTLCHKLHCLLFTIWLRLVSPWSHIYIVYYYHYHYNLFFFSLGGSYIMISHGDPDSRMQLIKQFTAPCKMDVKVLTIRTYYSPFLCMYVCMYVCMHGLFC